MKKTVLQTVLLGLIPYTSANTKLVLRPKEFFRDLERIENINQKRLNNAFNYAKKIGIIEFNGYEIVINEAGLTRIKKFQANKLVGNVELMVIFDIPEKYKNKRQQLRCYLKQMSFTQVQKSVWNTNMDLREELEEIIKQMNISKFVYLYECSKL